LRQLVNPRILSKVPVCLLSFAGNPKTDQYEATAVGALLSIISYCCFSLCNKKHIRSLEYDNEFDEEDDEAFLFDEEDDEIFLFDEEEYDEELVFNDVEVDVAGEIDKI